ncbi:OmpH family outer membrane protein [Mucilaginibacter sp. HMF5004]|uniref:OmpH family outer membrane protein n=1 Tax=Mucilaginibacter rivuli TaxID=2857527 RepID=UPI001C5CD26E|nr:OmpH family outer membrane protein [Mucilaginibacter rivuli]MBW4889654.1 OmpH family outer membrane protein [Mucilaginibacter rivuli]
MKKLFKVVLVALCVVFTANLAKAQSKIGYVYFNAVIDVMPEKAKLGKDLQDYQKTFVDRLQAMQTELQTKVKAYEAGRDKMTDAVRLQTEGELNDMNKRTQEYQNTAQQQVEQKNNELAKPLFDKVKAAVDAVAKEKGYGYIIDATQQVLVVMPAGDDITDAVKAKLGLGAPAAVKK